jgi:hypothetical protein
LDREIAILQKKPKMKSLTVWLAVVVLVLPALAQAALLTAQLGSKNNPRFGWAPVSSLPKSAGVAFPQMMSEGIGSESGMSSFFCVSVQDFGGAIWVINACSCDVYVQLFLYADYYQAVRCFFSFSFVHSFSIFISFLFSLFFSFSFSFSSSSLFCCFYFANDHGGWGLLGQV